MRLTRPCATVLVATVLVAGVLLAGCATSSDPPGDAARIDPELVAGLAPDDARAVGQAVNEFGFDLLGELADGETNVVTSPLSVATLLAMVLAGAGGDTATAMAEVLHLDDYRDVRVGALLGQLAGTDDVTLAVANSLWADEGRQFEADYLEFVQGTFGATLDEADLGAAATADRIDDWVAEQTRGRIESIAEDLELPDPAAVLVLVNAVYFLADWTTQFDAGDTVDQPFTLPDGGQVQAPLMHLRELAVPYADRDGYRVVRLPYGEESEGGQRYGMEVLLPDEDSSLGELLAGLDATEWEAAVGSLAEETVAELALPRFELEWDAQLKDPLTRLGMGQAFAPGADFRPMSPANPYLDAVVHKTYIRVDEAGTEAAAVTGGVMVESAMPDQLTFRVDRPFAFTISDLETGTILFLGTVTDP